MCMHIVKLKMHRKRNHESSVRLCINYQEGKCKYEEKCFYIFYSTRKKRESRIMHVQTKLQICGKLTKMQFETRVKNQKNSKITPKPKHFTKPRQRPKKMNIDKREINKTQINKVKKERNIDKTSVNRTRQQNR